MAVYTEGSGKIDFGAGEESSFEELGGAHRLMVNLVREPRDGGWIRLVPGTSGWDWAPTVWLSTGSEVTAITDFDGKLFYATADRKFYSVDAPGLNVARSTATAATQLQGAERCVFAKTKTRLFAAGGGVLSYWETMGNFAQVSSGPATAGFVAANSQRVVATIFDDSGQIVWTDALEGLHLTGWNELNFAEAEARPDKSVAVFENSNYIFVFGTTSTQAFAPDANVSYAPVSTTNVGTQAPHSIINLLDEKLFAWFSNFKEFVIGDAHTAPRVISGPMDKTFKELTTWNDCVGYRLRLSNMDLLVWRFPTLGIAYAFDLKSTRWLSIRGYSSTIGDWAPWPITAYHYWEERGLHIVGLADGTLQKVDLTSQTIAGQLLKGESITGFLDRGSPTRKKQTRILSIPVRRGEAVFGVVAPAVELSYRDAPIAWSQPSKISLGVAGDKKPVIEKRVVGRPYYLRQWRLEVAASAAVSFGPVEETFEVLGA